MKWLKRLSWAAAIALVCVDACFWECRDLPGTAEIRSELFTHYAPQGRCTWVPLAAISPKLQTAVVVWEDPDFYRHHGFAYEQIWRSFMADVRSRSYRRGGSTLTQQVAKNLFLGPEKTLRRKLREAVLAWRLEHALSKEEILEIYLNVAEWGEGIAGAEQAARLYFGKPAADLSWDQAALLAGMLANPRQYNPLRAPAAARRRRDAVLASLLADDELTSEEYRHALSLP